MDTDPDEVGPESSPRTQDRQAVESSVNEPPTPSPRRARPGAGRVSASKPAAAKRPQSAPARSQRTVVVVLSVLSASVAIVAVVAFSRSLQRPVEKDGPPVTTTVAPGTPTSLPAAALTTFRDPVTGFDISYPKAWERLEAKDPANSTLRLAVRVPPDAGINAFSIRVQRFDQPTTSDNIENIKAFTDGVVGSNKTAKVLQQKPVTIDGMPGYFYLYTYTDEATGAEGVHAHYFLFRGRKANQIVFQSAPNEFEGLADVFDQVINSFRSDPDN